MSHIYTTKCPLGYVGGHCPSKMFACSFYCCNPTFSSKRKGRVNQIFVKIMHLDVVNFDMFNPYDLKKTID